MQALHILMLSTKVRNLMPGVGVQVQNTIFDVVAASVQAVGDRSKIASKLTLNSTKTVVVRAVLIDIDYNGTISGEIGSERRVGDKTITDWTAHVGQVRRKITRLYVVEPADMNAESKAALWQHGRAFAGATRIESPSWLPPVQTGESLVQQAVKEFMDEYVASLPGLSYLKRRFSHNASLQNAFQYLEFPLTEVRHSYEGRPFVGYVDEPARKYFGQVPVDSSVAASQLGCFLIGLLVIGIGIAVILNVTH